MAWLSFMGVCITINISLLFSLINSKLECPTIHSPKSEFRTSSTLTGPPPGIISVAMSPAATRTYKGLSFNQFSVHYSRMISVSFFLVRETLNLSIYLIIRLRLSNFSKPFISTICAYCYELFRLKTHHCFSLFLPDPKTRMLRTSTSPSGTTMFTGPSVPFRAIGLMLVLRINNWIPGAFPAVNHPDHDEAELSLPDTSQIIGLSTLASDCLKQGSKTSNLTRYVEYGLPFNILSLLFSLLDPEQNFRTSSLMTKQTLTKGVWTATLATLHL